MSVIVPCFNYARYLPECIGSVLEQRGVETSVLIIDDASTDETPEVAEGLAGADSRISFRRHESNIGHIATFNEGLRWADGDYTVLLSSDDLITPGAFHRATSLMGAHPDVGLVYGPALRFHDGEPRPIFEIPSNHDWSYEVRSGLDWIADRCREGLNCICSPEVVVRTSIQRAVGGYRPWLPGSGDLEMWLRLAVHGSVGRILNAPQACYREHPASMQRDMFNTEASQFQLRVDAFDSFFRECVDLVPGGSELWEAARRAVAKQILWAACRHLDQGEADSRVVQGLVDFAFDTYTASDALPEYRSLRWRSRAGPQLSSALRPLLDGLYLRRLRSWLRWRARVTKGV